MVSVASGLLGAANVNLLAHIAINLELPDWRQLKAHHWARMELSDLAAARAYASELLDLEAGAPGAPGLQMLGASPPSVSQMAHLLMDLCQYGKSVRDVRPTGTGGLTADALAEGLAAYADGKGGARGRSLKRLPDGDCRAIMTAAYTGGLVKHELSRNRAGVKLVSDAAYYTTFRDSSGQKEAVFPKYDELPFDEVISEDGVRIYDPKMGRYECVRDAFLAMLTALEACSQRTVLPVLFRNTAAPLGTLSSGAGFAQLRRTIMQETQTLTADQLLTELKALQNKMGLWSQTECWELTMYPRADSYVSRWEERYPLGGIAKPVEPEPKAVVPADKTPAALDAQIAKVSAAEEKLLRKVAALEKEKADARTKLQKLGHFTKSEMKQGLHLGFNGGGGRGRGGGRFQQYAAPQQQQMAQYYPQQRQQQQGPTPPPGPPPGAPLAQGQFAQPLGPGQCRDFANGRCTRGAACKFAH